MAKILGGIGMSHVPTIGVAYDKKKWDQPAWAPLFDGAKPAADWLAAVEPDVLVFVYNDHLNAFFYDLYPTFSIGAGAEWDVADEGAGRRPLPMLPGDTAFATHLAEQLLAAEFDMAVFHDRPLDHGVFSPLPLLWPHEGGWPGAVVPLMVNVVRFPLPTPMRCWRLGRALRRAIQSYPDDLKVVIVGTGGLSHQIHGERTGHNDTDWDMRFLDLLETDPRQLAEMRHVDYVRLGGAEGAEAIMWLVMRGALGDEVVRRHRSYYLATTTAMTTLVFEEKTVHEPTLAEACPGNPQTAGIEEIWGTYPFDIPTGVRNARLNRFFWDLRLPERRTAFRADEVGCCLAAGLDEDEIELVRARDWLGLVRRGANFFVLEKFARLVGVSNLEVYAEMRGETFDEFLATRRVPDAR